MIDLLNPIREIPYNNIFYLNSSQRNEYLFQIKEYLNYVKNQVENASCLEDVDLDILDRGLPVFNLSYYGFSIKEILENTVCIYKNLFKEYIEQINKKYNQNNNSNNFKKILFFSSRMNCDSSVYKSTYGILNHLSKVSNFKVDLMTKFPVQDEVLDSYSNCKNIIECGNLIENIEKIGSGNYDMIIYPDMNMDPITSCIGMFRLSPNQITTFGHSESSGMADYYVTSKYYEKNAIENYTEKPVLFDSLGFIYKKINIEQVIKNLKPREYFQIHKDCNIYFCNSSFFKMGKEMFEIFKGILDKDEKAVIFLTKLSFSDYDFLFYVALEQNLGLSYSNRIRFLPRLNADENMNVLYLSDVFIESYPFGNMNSTLECFAVGLPVVSMPTTKINGRFTYGFYKKMNLEYNYCVNSIEEYVNKAVQIANEKNKHRRVEILNKSNVLFEDQDSGYEWENFIRSL